METPKRLFNEYEAFNEKGNQLYSRVRLYLNSVFDDLSKEGYSLRDAQLIAETTIQGMIAEKVLRNAMVNRKGF